MAAVGIVFIPGMIEQILAGADPATATGYQIVVMLMVAAATALGSVTALLTGPTNDASDVRWSVPRQGPPRRPLPGDCSPHAEAPPRGSRGGACAKRVMRARCATRPAVPAARQPEARRLEQGARPRPAGLQAPPSRAPQVQAASAAGAGRGLDRRRRCRCGWCRSRRGGRRRGDRGRWCCSGNRRGCGCRSSVGRHRRRRGDSARLRRSASCRSPGSARRSARGRTTRARTLSRVRRTWRCPGRR